MQACRLLMSLGRVPAVSSEVGGQDLWSNDRQRWYSKKPVPMTPEEMAETETFGATISLPPAAAKIRAAQAENGKPKDKLSKTAASYKERQKEKAKIRTDMLERSKKQQEGEEEKKQRRLQRLEQQKAAAQAEASVEIDHDAHDAKEFAEAFGNDGSDETKIASKKRKMQRFIDEEDNND